MWNNFKLSSFNDEETVNNALYKKELFKITSDDLVQETPKVKAICQLTNVIVISVDKSLFIIDENSNNNNNNTTNNDGTTTIVDTLDLSVNDATTDAGAAAGTTTTTTTTTVTADCNVECKYLSFSQKIEIMHVAKNGQFILCALDDGNIHGVHINKGIPIFNVIIQEKDISMNGDHQTFVGIQETFDNNFYILCTNGSFYRLFNFNENVINNNILKCDQSITFNETLPTTVTLELIEEKSPIIIYSIINEPAKHNIISFSIIPMVKFRQMENRDEGTERETINDNELVNNKEVQQTIDELNELNLIICSDLNNLYFLHEQKYYQIEMPIEDGGIKLNGIKSIYNLNHLILGLSNSGHFIEICPYTKLQFPFENFEYLIEDCIILENNGIDIEMLLLTKKSSSSFTGPLDGDQEQQQQFLKIIDFYSMQLKYELSITKQNVWLMEHLKSSMNMYYLSGDSNRQENENENEKNTCMVIQEISMNTIEETEPIDRLRKLLHRGLFDEAEDFANKMELSLQSIFEAKSKKILLEINSLTPDDKHTIEMKFQLFYEQITKITNFNFLLTLRNIDIPNRKLLQKFLNYLLNHLERESYEYGEIFEKLQRLQTLQLIDPFECDLEWQEFISHPNILTICIRKFKINMSHACLIWKNHSSSIIQSPSSSSTSTSTSTSTSIINGDGDDSDSNSEDDNRAIINILNSIPSDTEPFNVIQWLRHFVPIVLQTHPSVMSDLVNWSLDKNRSLQFTTKLWPDIGIEFCINLFEIFTNVTFLLQNAHRMYERNMAKIKRLKLTLETLVELKQTYNLQLSLDDYINDSIEETAFHILQHINLENLNKLVNNFINPLFMEKGILPTVTLIRYIKFLIKYKKSISLWQERGIACIELLSNECDKLTCVLEILKASPIPWSETVKSLLKYGGKLRYSSGIDSSSAIAHHHHYHTTIGNHPLAGEIYAEYERQNIKIMKLKYGWNLNGFDSNMKLIYRIVKVKIPNELCHDIHTVIKYDPSIENEADFYCCYELARNSNTIDLAIKYFNSLNYRHHGHGHGHQQQQYTQFSQSKEEESSDEDGQNHRQNRCLIKFFNILEHMLEDKQIEINEEFENEMEFLKICIAHAGRPAGNIKTIQKEFQQLQNKKILRKKFNIIHLNQYKSIRIATADGDVDADVDDGNYSIIGMNSDGFLHTGIKSILDGIRKKREEKIQLNQSNQLIDYIWNEMNCLIHALNLNQIYGFIELLKLFNNIHLTCAITKLIIEIGDLNLMSSSSPSSALSWENSQQILNLIMLLICQQTDFMDAPAPQQLQQQIPLAYPLAYRLLTYTIRNDKINYAELNDLIGFVRIGQNAFDWDTIQDYFRDPIDFDKCMLDHLFDDCSIHGFSFIINQHSIDDDNDILEVNNHENGGGGGGDGQGLKQRRKESMSIFENIKTVSSNQSTKSSSESIIKSTSLLPSSMMSLLKKKPEPIIRCLSLAIKLLISMLNNSQNSEYLQEHQQNMMFKRLNQYFMMSTKKSQFKSISIESIKKEFFQSMEQLIKTKQQSIAFIIMQFILKYQKEMVAAAAVTNGEGTSQGVAGAGTGSTTTMVTCVLTPSIVSIFNRKILKYSLQEKEPNFIEAAVILASDKKQDQCIAYLRNELKIGYMKLNYLTLIEFFYGVNSRVIIDLESNPLNSRINHYYFNELCKMDPSIKSHKTPLEFESIEQFLHDIQSSSTSTSLSSSSSSQSSSTLIDVHLLMKMSNDLKWNVQEVLVLQVLYILNKQELQFDVINNSGSGSGSGGGVDNHQINQNEIYIKTTSTEIQLKCQSYINEITDINLFIRKLMEFFHTINFYFYELYLCVLNIISMLTNLSMELQHYRNILLFLKLKMTTLRFNRISQLETDCWLRLHKNMGVLPKIAKYRFPFKLIIQRELKNILDEEVNVENCSQWFPLIKMHAELHNENSEMEIIQSIEFYCMASVKNSIFKYKNILNNSNEYKKEDNWNLIPINNSFLQSILRLIKYMKDLSKILSVLYFVMNQAPEGADQIEAAYECYKFVDEHQLELNQQQQHQQNQQSATVHQKHIHETCIKIKRKYPILKTQHLLHLYNLIDDRLLQLIECPRELIIALYHHNSILKSNSIDINKLSTEIAQLHGLNIFTIQMVLLKKWLTLSGDLIANGSSHGYDNGNGMVMGSGDSVDETFTEDLNLTISNDGGGGGVGGRTSTESTDGDGDYNTTINDESSILRAHYILNSWDSEKAISALVAYIFSDDGNINTIEQLKVLECFIKIIDDNYKDLIKQEQYVNLKCIYGLKQLGFSNMTVAKFKNYDKLMILKQIWKLYSNNPVAIDCIANICIGYQIFLPTIWNNVLKQMINFNMVKQLKAIIELLSTKRELLSINGLAQAWELIIKLPFKNADNIKSYELDGQLSKSLFLLQSCPIAMKINTIELAEYCIRYNRPYMAAILIIYTDDEKRKSIVINMINAHKTETLKKDIIALEEFGIFSFVINFAIRALEL